GEPPGGGVGCGGGKPPGGGGGGPALCGLRRPGRRGGRPREEGAAGGDGAPATRRRSPSAHRLARRRAPCRTRSSPRQPGGDAEWSLVSAFMSLCSRSNRSATPPLRGGR